MKSALLLAGELWLTVGLMAGCWITPSAVGEGDAGKAPAASPAEVRQPNCQEWAGTWRTYQQPAGVTAKMCGDEPCEGVHFAGYLKLECERESLAGSKQLVFATYPPPGREVRATLDIQREGAGYKISYVDSLKCVVTYTVMLQGSKIAGEYSVAKCDDIQWLNKGGSFLAVRASNPESK